MHNVKKKKYIEPEIVIIEVEMDLMICGSDKYKTPEVQDEEEEVANPYWNVL